MKGGDIRFQGTWVHPQVAINLAQWLSAKFAVQVSQWVFDWMSGKSPATAAETVPYHLRRYVANQPNVPVGHFSVLTEMTQLLIAPMEIMGYTLPEHMLPDISHGKMFANGSATPMGLIPMHSQPISMCMKTGGASGPRPILTIYLPSSGSIFGKTGCRTELLNISGRETVKPFNSFPS